MGMNVPVQVLCWASVLDHKSTFLVEGGFYPFFSDLTKSALVHLPTHLLGGCARASD